MTPATDATEPRARTMVDAAALASKLGVSRDFVYAHAEELGAIRLGSGPRARLRFDVGLALERLTACSAGRTSAPAESAPALVSRRRRASRLGTGVELLPIRGLPPSQSRTVDVGGEDTRTPAGRSSSFRSAGSRAPFSEAIDALIEELS